MSCSTGSLTPCPRHGCKGALLSDIDGERRCVLCARPEAFEPVVHTLQEVRFDKVASTRLVRGYTDRKTGS